jgi:signal transduction histidine kinase
MKISVVFLTAILCLYPIVRMNAQIPQNKASELMKLGKSSLEQKEYTKARYLFKQAYGLFAAQDNYGQAIECGLQTGALYTRENYVRESSELFNSMERLILSGEEKLQKPLYNLRFAVTHERLGIYLKMNAREKAKAELDKLSEITGMAKNDSLNKVMSGAEISYYYTFKLNDMGDACVRKLITGYIENKEYDKAGEVYRNIIETARNNNNTTLAYLAYERLILWTDSLKTFKTRDELNTQKKMYNQSLRTIGEKEEAVSAKNYIIAGLCLLSAILVAALVCLFFVLLRFLVRNRTLRKNIQDANEINSMKSEFIRNISERMEPVLSTISTSVGELTDKDAEQAQLIQIRVNALKKFCGDIQELAMLENSLTELYDTEEINTDILCKMVMNKIREYIRPEVSVSSNAPGLKIRTNPEQLERVLLHLLKNAVSHTKTGYIVLDFKRKGPRTCQFVITDSGTGIAEDRREYLFKPFSGKSDLTRGNGMGLAICRLIATKLGGSLTLDETYNKGCRFILELHS